MVVLGADPDKKPDREWYDSWSRPSGAGAGWQFNPQIKELVNYVCYHRHTTMGHQFPDSDKGAIAGWAGKRLRQGYTIAQIKKATDRFYQHGVVGDRPALPLVKGSLQSEYFDEDAAAINDPLLEWFIGGMPDEGPFDDPRGIRSLLLLSCHEGLLRYPEVVITILRSHGDMGQKRRLLSALEYIIRWNLKETDDKDELVLCQRILKPYGLPSELQSKVAGGLRPAAENASRSIERMQGTRRVSRTD